MGRVVLDGLSEASRKLNEKSARRDLWETYRERANELDGHVFICVSSTGIYCRPVCSAQRPKLENCLFVTSALEAEALGYRPCLRCRPELAPWTKRVGEEDDLAWRTLSLIREFCSEGVDCAWAARRLEAGVEDMENALQEKCGTGFDAALRRSRLHLAKALLADTRIGVEHVALACGFKDARELIDTMADAWRLSPADLRKRPPAALPEGVFGLHLSYRAPFEFERLLSFFRDRELKGVERIGETSYSRTVRIAGIDDVERDGWIRVEDEPRRSSLRLTASESLLPVVSQVVARVRRTFDLDCDPLAVHEGLEPLESVVPGANVCGTRVPGAFDGFEIATRAILGQQVSVKAANKLAARIAEGYGDSVLTGIEGLEKFYPTARELLALPAIEDALGELGVVRTRSRAIQAVAALVDAGTLVLNPCADVFKQMRRLLEVKGIGVWSQNYIAMRTLGYTDAFLEADAGIKHALPQLAPKERSAAVEPCRPWRAYANVCLWNSLAGRER